MKKRGNELDIEIQRTLDKYINISPEKSPISRKLIQVELNLKSRGTLSLKHRADMISNARIEQFNKFGMSLNRKGRRKNKDETIQELKCNIKLLEEQRSQLISALSECLIRSELNGVNISDVINLENF